MKQKKTLCLHIGSHRISQQAFVQGMRLPGNSNERGGIEILAFFPDHSLDLDRRRGDSDPGPEKK
jgi:hypothetical protein